MPTLRTSSRDELTAKLRRGVTRLLEDGRSYPEIAIDTLVAEGGVAKSTFYAHFTDRDELLRAIASTAMRDLIAIEGAWWTLPCDASRAETRRSLATMYAAYRSHGPLMASIVEATAYDPLMREQFRELVDAAVAATAEHLTACQAGTRPSIPADAATVAFWLTWTLERGFVMMQTTSDPTRLERQLDAIAGIVWSVLRSGD